MTQPWIGVDLDGTLAEYHGWQNDMHIGKPIEAMAARVRRWLADGRVVKVFTARVAPKAGRAIHTPEEITRAIQTWTQTHLGARLEVTCEKDYGMVQLWDDRAVQVEPNTGRRVDGGA